VRHALRDLVVVLAASWLARLAFVAAVGDAHSLDVDYWGLALDARHAGRNPYETGVLNWPPLWLEVIVGVENAADLTGVSFLNALRVFLVAVESILVVTLYVTLVSVGASHDAIRRALLFGVALNPIAILLVCQHGNSDVVVGLFVTLTIAALIAHRRSRDIVLWLVGCLMLGLGVLAKTVPLVLAPLLAPGARIAPPAGKALGATLVVGPAAVGVSVILALAPAAVLEHVIRYRSTRGFFGVGGVLDLASDDAHSIHGWIFTVSIVVMLLWLWRLLSPEEPLPAEQLFLLAAVILMIVIAFGSGYGPQYAYWVLPALVATYVLLDDGWRRVLRAGYLVAALTYVGEYAFVPWLGAYAGAMFPDSGWVADTSGSLDVPYRLVLFTLPLFLVYLLFIAEGIARLAEQTTSRARPTSLPSSDPP
jgi:hypothetical protein